MYRKIQFNENRVWEVEEFTNSTQIIGEHDVLYTLDWMEPDVTYGAEVHQDFFNVVDDERGIG